MRSEWDQPPLVKAWAAAMNNRGDYWRRSLVNPLVLAVAEALATGADPYRLSAFEALSRALRPTAPRPTASRSAAVSVVDFGCGEGYLGRLLAAAGATYLGVESSKDLLGIAQRRASAAGSGERLSFAQVNLEDVPPNAGLAAIDARIWPAAPPSLITAITLLDHMAEVAPFLQWIAARLSRQQTDVPFLCVTLAAERFDPGAASLNRSGGPAGRTRAHIDCCNKDVDVYLRARRMYEQCFRDAGLFVRRCEPLHFHRLHAEADPDRRDDVSRHPEFWAWLLSARRGAVAGADGAGWPADSDASALRASTEAIGTPVAPGPRVYDFGAGEAIIRLHNMGGELYAVLSGTARMMDGNQEVMTFRAGEVLGDLETPDASGQCGWFPFDVIANAGGCRVAVFPESTARQVLAGSRDMGSRFFRLLRDRLRLALWHYDIREMVGEYIEVGSERLETRLLHRCARALLWASAIEGRGRASALPGELAFLDPETIARRFKPGTERIDFGVVVRQLHLLRMIDAFPGAGLRKEEEARAAESWDALLSRASESHLTSRSLDARLGAALRAHAGRVRVTGQLTKDGSRTRAFQDVVDDIVRLSQSHKTGADWAARVERWSAYVARAHRFWEDRNPWLIVLRDVPGLRRIAMGDAGSIDASLRPRAEYLLSDARRPTWELMTAQTTSSRRNEYIALWDAFVAADLGCGGGLAFSSDGAGAG